MSDTAAIGTYAAVFNGKTPAKADQRNSGHPVLKIRDVDETGIFRGRFESFVQVDFASVFETRKVRAGDTLILNAAHNAAYVGSKQFRAGPEVDGALATGEWLIIRPDNLRLDSGFAHYWLTSPMAKRRMQDMVKGIHLYPKDVERLEIPLPPLPEQRRIAAILDKADALRRKRKRAIELLDSLTQSIFLEMFGGAKNNAQQQPLGEIAELINGDRSSNYPSGDDIVRSGILFLNTSNITKDGLDLSSANYITPEKFASLTRGKLQTGDIVITLRGSLGQSALFENAGDTGFINAQMMIIRPKSEIEPKYLLQALQLDDVLAHLKRIGSGSAVPQLTAKQMSELPIRVPDPEQQKAFGIQRRKIQHARREAASHLLCAESLFASLQHRAFSGQL